MKYLTYICRRRFDGAIADSSGEINPNINQKPIKPMKKVFLALGVACMIGLASCNSTDSKIDKLGKLMDEMTELTQKAQEGDLDAAEELVKVGKEAKAVAEDLSKEDLTDEQKARLAKMMFGIGK